MSEPTGARPPCLSSALAPAAKAGGGAPAGPRARPWAPAPGEIGPDRLRDAVRAWIAQRALLLSFIRTDLKSRYGQAVLGFGWSVVEPLLLIAIYGLLFSVILRVRFPGPGGEGHGGFVVYLMCALIPWLAVSESIQRCVDCLRENSNLLRKVYFAPGILPAAIVGANLFVQVVALGIFVLLLGGLGYKPTAALVALPVTLLLQTPLTLGICWTVAALNLFHRDVKHFVNLGLTLWMFVTPIFYPSTLVSDRFDWLLKVNPLAFIVDLNRVILLEGRLPPARPVAIVAALSFSACLLGALVFVRRQHRFVDAV